MTTTLIQSDVQRARFIQHAFATLAAFVPRALRLPSASRLSPAVSAGEIAMKEARELRERAWRYAKTDPAFATDLCAAADRHEILHGV
ncbi:MAG: hypothetical protein ABIQ60_11310 [Burkholderiaceae bacterium]